MHGRFASLLCAAFVIFLAGNSFSSTYAVTATRAGQNLYELSTGEIVSTRFCYEFVYFDRATLRVDYNAGYTVGVIVFSGRATCDVAGVYGPYTSLAAGTYSATLSYVDTSFYFDEVQRLIIRGGFGCPITYFAASSLVLSSSGPSYRSGLEIGTIAFSNLTQSCPLLGMYGWLNLASVPATFTLSVTKAGSGTVSSTPAGIACGAICSASFSPGVVVTLTATPASGSAFSGWSGACSGAGPCSVTMDTAKNVAATFNVAGTPGALSGLWWNAGESGWGINFTQRGNIVFAAWYTYDNAGNPKWYVAPHCALPAASASGSCSETLYEVNGPVFFGAAFNPSAAHVAGAGTIQLSFTSASTGSMTYAVGGQTRTVAISRQIFPTAVTAPPPVDYTDLWWNPNESGWGVAITHQFRVIFLAWYVYDSAGKPVWYVVPDCSVGAALNACQGTLYRTTGPAFGPTFNPSQVQVFSAGTVSLIFTDPNNATLGYTVNGVSASKVITRQLF